MVPQGVQAQYEAEHARKNEEYQFFCGVQEGVKSLILYAVGRDALAPLEERYIGFGNADVHGMIAHLQDKMAIKISDQEKEAFKQKGYAKPWDTTVHLATFFKELKELGIHLTKKEIHNTEEERTLVAVARIQETAFFPSKVIMDWKKKPLTDKT